jgi:hypothetical protein
MEVEERRLQRLKPLDADGARQVLEKLVDRQVARLDLILASNQELADADRAEAPARLAFDYSADGDKLRRYSLSAARLIN